MQYWVILNHKGFIDHYSSHKTLQAAERAKKKLDLIGPPQEVQIVKVIPVNTK